MLKMVDANSIEFVHEQCEALRKIFYPQMEEALNMGRKKTLKAGDAVTSLGEGMPVSKGATVVEVTPETGLVDMRPYEVINLNVGNIESSSLTPEICELIEREVVRRVRAIAPDVQSLVARVEALEMAAQKTDSLTGTSLDI